MTKHILLSLPWPPTINNARIPVRRGGKMTLITSKEARSYKTAATLQAKLLAYGRSITGRVSVHIDALPPNAGRRDLDNLLKLAIDCIVAAGIIEDDSRIDHLSITRMPPVPGGELMVIIEAMP